MQTKFYSHKIWRQDITCKPRHRWIMGPVTVSCEHCNEPRESVKGRKFLQRFLDCHFLKVRNIKKILIIFKCLYLFIRCLEALAATVTQMFWRRRLYTTLPTTPGTFHLLQWYRPSITGKQVRWLLHLHLGWLHYFIWWCCCPSIILPTRTVTLLKTLTGICTIS